ncbi:MAG TPA: hypothetical protein VF173_11830 [Thermoanaerobaculia bacterium]|nr:hypothetical protein [Thermoanaerobaculia bacterium]
MDGTVIRRFEALITRPSSPSLPPGRRERGWGVRASKANWLLRATGRGEEAAGAEAQAGH